ncbi:MAG: flagellar basal body P-ring protein FlgI [Phycisphaeraceae bacterium]
MFALTQTQGASAARGPRRTIRTFISHVKPWVLITLALSILVACSTGKKAQAPAPTPPPTYTGPEHFHGTIASMVSLRGFNQLPVSGFGFVVGLDGTGSAEVPAYLKQWLINYMRKQGIGSAKMRTQWLSPDAFIADPNTTVVKLEGLTPPGAVPGTRFDVLVTAIDRQTTSLEGGTLYTFDLGIDGANPSMRFTRALATAQGDLYLTPMDNDTPDEKRIQLQRQAVVLSGGVVKEARIIELVLNQPSWQRSRLIADRINERIPKSPQDRFPTAEPKTDQIIRINVPRRYAGRPEKLLSLMSMIYLQQTPNFEPEQARRLADVLVKDPSQAPSIVLAWQALGKTTLPVLRQFYEHPNPSLRVAALDAGSRLEDQGAVEAIVKLSQDSDTAQRIAAAGMLANLPRSLRGAHILKGLLDDADESVRVAAYEALSNINDPLVQRRIMGGREDFKFVLDLVPSKTPMIYITQTDLPRIAIFNPGTSFKTPLFAHLWDSRLMIRQLEVGSPAKVGYQELGEPEVHTYDISPFLANFVLLLAHRQAALDDTPGLDLTYSQVVSAVYTLWKQGQIEASLRLDISPIAAALAAAQQDGPTIRPETMDEPATQPAPAPPATPVSQATP